jgi:hypothetical protein
VLETNTPTFTPTPIYCATQSMSPTSVPYSTRVLALSPIAYWPLTENAGTVAIDATGNGRHGVYSGVVLGGQTFLNGDRTPSFDGVNDYVNIYTPSIGTAFNINAGSVSFWFNPNATQLASTTSYELLMFNDSAVTNGVRVFKTGVANQFFFRRASQTITVTISSAQWTHIAMTWDTAQNRLIAYVGGNQQGSPAASPNISSFTLTSTRATLGAHNTSGTLPFNGGMSNAAFWARELSSSEVANLANLNAPSPTPTSIPGCTPFVPTATATSQFDVSGVNNQISTMSAILNATPVPAPTASGADPGAYAGQAFGFLLGISTVHFGVFTPLIQFAFFALFTFIGLRVAFFLIPVIAAFIGIIRKIVQVILDFIPG